jgi:hypothetical protein
MDSSEGSACRVYMCAQLNDVSVNDGSHIGRGPIGL